jgi:multimeric flavodoxin WrbA
MKIVAIHGSPRKGNSSAITDHLLLSAEEVGAKTKSFYLNKMTFRGCQACYACKTMSDSCVLDDELAPVLDAILEADVVVLASPVYFGDITGQLKSFFDRTFSFFTPDYRTTANPSRLPSGKSWSLSRPRGTQTLPSLATTTRAMNGSSSGLASPKPGSYEASVLPQSET